MLLTIMMIGCGDDATNPNNKDTSEVTVIDSDNDGLSDEDELSFGSDPNNPDSDNDGF